MAQIEIKSLYKYFGETCRLHDINMSIDKGESCVIIGGSGSGKSVLIKTIVGLFSATSGSIKIDDIETIGLSNKKYQQILQKTAFLFQGGALFDSLTIWQNVAFQLLFVQKMSKKEVIPLVKKQLEIVGLKDDILDLFPNELSGGMQKRVAIARALISKPEIIFFDEPTSGLDPINADLINQLIIKCNQELELTTITITHDLKSAHKIANPNIAVIFEGELLFFDHKDKLQNSANEYVQKLLNVN